MKQRLAGFIAIVLVAGVAAGVLWSRHGSEAARRDRLVREFLTVVPDSLDSARRLEIQQLFYTFYKRADAGLVAGEDIDAITDKLAGYVSRGRITPSDLLHFMAEVGYTTYKGEPRANLEGGTVDHPILNPQSALVPIRFDSSQFDSSFWADFEQWKRDNPELVDSIYKLYGDSIPAR